MRTVEIPLRSGLTTQTEAFFPQNDEIDNRLINFVEVYYDDVAQVSPSGLNLLTLAELKNTYITIADNQTERIQKIPCSDFVPFRNNGVRIPLEELRINLTSSSIYTQTAIGNNKTLLVAFGYEK